MCGLVINVVSFVHLLRKVDFDAVVDHLAIMHIMRSKVEPATIKIKRLLEVLSSYSFNLCYIKGKDMILSDFLSRQNVDNSNPCEIIPISFKLRTMLQDKYYNLEGENERYMIQTRSQMKASGCNCLRYMDQGGDWIHIKYQKTATANGKTEYRVLCNSMLIFVSKVSRGLVAHLWSCEH